MLTKTSAKHSSIQQEQPDLKILSSINSSVQKAAVFIAAITGLTMSLADIPSVEAQIAVTSDRHGICYSGRNRLPCFYPSANGLYSNVRNIQITGGSGADVLWEAFTPLNWNGGVSAGVVLNIGGKMYLRSGVSACVIGFPQHRQSTFCNNPYRGTQRLVRVMVRPHNANWQTNFKLTPD
jgi:hypothetical protein